MTEIYNFIVKLKEIDLYGYAHPCCDNDPNAECSCDNEDDKAQDDLCMFDYCLSWDSLYSKLHMVDNARRNDQLGQALALSLGGFMGSMGLGKDHLFNNSLKSFYLQTGKIGMITSSFLAASYGAYPVIEAAVKSEYYNSSAAYVGANFLAYGGNSFVGDLLGLFEVGWVIAYLMLAGDLAIVPLVLAREMDDTYVKMADEEGTVKQAVDFQYLFYAFLIAMGSWFSAIAMQKSATRLIGFFDIQDTDGISVYESYFGAGTRSFDNGLWLTVDILNHTIAVTAYFAIATALSVVSQVFVHCAMTGECLPE